MERCTESYTPRTSGLLHGSGGVRRRRYRKLPRRANLPDIPMTDATRIKREIPAFDPDLEYDGRELVLLAEKILLEDGDPHEGHAWLNGAMYKNRLAHEIYTSIGTPDPSIVEGLYWRTHPQGRRWSTKEVRKITGCAFYDGVIETSRTLDHENVEASSRSI